MALKHALNVDSGATCRYLKDLPPGLDQFNETCLRQQQSQQSALQSAVQIRRIINEAKYLAGYKMESYEDGDDEEVDYMLDDHMGEHSNSI